MAFIAPGHDTYKQQGSRGLAMPNDHEVFKSNHMHFFYDLFLSDELINQTILEHGPADVLLSSFYSKLDSAHNIFCFPLAFYGCTIPVAVSINHSSPTVVKTDYCFNFSANNKRINRFIMIKLIEWFGLVNLDYTWSGADANFDMSIIIQEMNSVQTPPWSKEFESFILSPIAMQKKWIDVPGDALVQSTHIRPGSITGPWHAGLDQLYSHSAVSLISESIEYQPGIGYTEKTAYAVFGQTFPIWVGGKYQAEQFAKLGYDTFDDVIDHSYQYRDTVIERCYYAIADNLDILRNLEHATALRTNMAARLAENRQKLLTDCTVTERILAKFQKIVKDFPMEDYTPITMAGAIDDFHKFAEIFPGVQFDNQPGSRKRNFEYLFNTITANWLRTMLP
jgi:hypothetical protein